MDSEKRTGFLKMSQSGLRNLVAELLQFDVRMAAKRAGKEGATLFELGADFTTDEADKIKMAVDFLNMADEITECMKVLNRKI